VEQEAQVAQLKEQVVAILFLEPLQPQEAVAVHLMALGAVLMVVLVVGMPIRGKRQALAQVVRVFLEVEQPRQLLTKAAVAVVVQVISEAMETPTMPSLEPDLLEMAALL
jgi:hypothetical protein